MELPDFLDTAPDGFDPDLWGRLPPGARLRWLKVNDGYALLTWEQYRELRRLPYWMSYGPEHGLPPELFNDRGLLLPKYRPGGGRSEDFEAWRRRFRHASWQLRQTQRALERWDREYGGWTLVILGAIFIGPAILASSLIRRALDLHEFLGHAITWALLLVGYFVVNGFAFSFVKRWVLARAMRRVDALESAWPDSEHDGVP